MKRNKNITVALTEAEAETIQKLAEADRRPPAQYIYLIITDYLANKRNG